MELHGANLIGFQTSGLGETLLYGYDPKAGEQLTPGFHEATTEEIETACTLASAAFKTLRTISAEQIAAFLEQIAANIVDLGDQLIAKASQETGLPKDRITGERGRTVGQLRMFVALVREGSWVDARIDPALPDRKPLPRPDLRRMLVPIGPIAVYGASNFPLAFSVAGGDTAAALAARNPVIVKAHPAHPGTSELTGSAIIEAAKTCGMPEGVFSLLQGASPEMSLSLVTHPLIKGGAFTGSLRAGRALFNAASQRPEPIPFYAEMGSVNPVFVLPGALKERGESIGQGLNGSVNLGVGQFCTNPGLVLGIEDDGLKAMTAQLRAGIEKQPGGAMLYPSILRAYEKGLDEHQLIAGVTSTKSELPADRDHTEATAVLLETDASTFINHEALRQELFGPSTLIVRCSTREELESAASCLEGSLTATIHATPDDLVAFKSVIATIEDKVGRILFNGYPTGVEVCPSMNHGGPFPATMDAKYTSVGTASIFRFVRPICYQSAPQNLLPVELQDGNPRGIWRLVEGSLSKQ